MLPEELSTDLTSLNEEADRGAIVLELVVGADGSISSPDVYRAVVRNRAQLTYSGVGPWLEERATAPAKVAASADLQAQLKLQDEAAQALRAQRHRFGALQFDRIEAEPVIEGGQVKGISAHQKNRASDLIEDFMIAANEVMARTLQSAGVSSIRRVVRSPERWPRIVELAAQYGEKLPAEPDSKALDAFMQKRRLADEAHFPDLSLAIIKLMGPGEYVLVRPNDPDPCHFALAAHDYTHSTAPNRRFADLVTQRLLKTAATPGAPCPYTEAELAGIAAHCTEREDAARKVERLMRKVIAANLFSRRIGETFDAIITGATSKGTYARLLKFPAEGMVVKGAQGLDVGDKIQVRLLSVDVERGFIDFERR
jgi:exoribonuclease-2